MFQVAKFTSANRLAIANVPMTPSPKTMITLDSIDTIGILVDTIGNSLTVGLAPTVNEQPITITLYR